ncbi:MAG: DUF2931 family protein [Gammaproteobacteria bacterium]|nr:DUF2931 family protein [Gammaproteobacteria bacterium]
MTTKFDWLATESAPKNYPMKIVQGTLFYPGSGSLYVPNRKKIHYGWGTSISTHVVGPDLKPLPERLEITFFSYTENQFYHGVFDLPYDKILALMQAGFYSPKAKKQITYNEIRVGVAPGGTVSVWLDSIDGSIEVFSGQAEKADTDWKRINDNPKITREEYVRSGLENTLTPEALQTLKQNGVPLGLWQTYRKRYDWQPLFTGIEPPALIQRIRYFNGENEFLYYPLSEAKAAALRAIPQSMIVNLDWPGIGKLRFDFDFNEEEIFAAFKKISSQGLPFNLEMRVAEKPDKSHGLWIVIANEKEYVVLDHTHIKTYGTAE